MKRIAIVFLTMLAFNNAYSQTAYYDAIYLKSKINPETGKIILHKDVQQLFMNYYPGTIEDSINEDLLDLNPFIKGYFASLVIQSGIPINFNPIKLSSIGGLDVTNIVDGFAKFLVKRTKQELNVSFFSRFKEEISKPEFKDLQTVFPQTYRTFTIIGDEIYNYEAYIQTLRESFENDLASLTTNLPSVIENHPEFFTKFPELEATLQSGCYIAGELRDKVHPGDILNDFPDDYLNKLNPNWKGSLQTLQLISASLRDSSKSDSVYWVSPKQIKKLTSDSIAFKIYLGLIYQQALKDYNSIQFQDKNLISILNSVAGKYDPYKKYITRFGEKTNKLTSLIKNYKKTVNDSLAFEQYAAYFSASIDLLEFSAEAGKLPGVDLPYLADSLKNYFDVAQTSCDLVLAVNRRNYGGAVTDAAHIYDIVRPKMKKENDASVKKDLNDQIRRLAENTKNLKNKVDSIEREIKIKHQSNTIHSTDSGNLQILKDELKDSLTNLTIKQEIKISSEQFHLFFKYGTFMATMVQSDNSDDVAKAIEAAALPSGSSRIKRETPFNVSLNAYTGFFVGHEKIVGVNDSQWINSYGLTAPIGVAISTGSHKFLGMPSKKNEKHWSYSAFISLVDIGTVAAFRFQNTDSVAQVPTINLKDIFSPGLFISVGIPKCPLSFNLGAQVGPNLRNVYVEDTQNSGQYVNIYQDNVYWRFSASIVVDIPILNFYTKSK